MVMSLFLSGPPPSDYGTARERTDAYNGGPGHGGGHQYRRPPDYPVRSLLYCLCIKLRI